MESICYNVRVAFHLVVECYYPLGFKWFDYSHFKINDLFVLLADTFDKRLAWHTILLKNSFSSFVDANVKWLHSIRTIR